VDFVHPAAVVLVLTIGVAVIVVIALIRNDRRS
jgi:hypothetical protein